MIKRAPRRSAMATAALLALAIAVPALGQDGVTIDSGPDGPTNNATPTFTFSGPDGAQFECALDGEQPQACTSPHPTDSLGDGPHVFEVQAGGSSASRSFTVDTRAPDVQIDAPGTVDDDTAFTATFSSSEGGARFACALDGAAEEPCTSPYRSPDLPNGNHTLVVSASDRAGNTGQGQATVTLDVPLPETTIDSGPDGETTTKTPAFAFSADRARSTFKCALDDAEFATCPAAYTTAPLEPGPHVLRVRAVDAGGNEDASPAERSFQVVDCETSVKIGVVEARAECFRREGSELVADGQVVMNGITFDPVDDRKLAFDPEARTVALRGVHLRMGSVSLFRGDVKFTVPEGDRLTLARIDLGTFQRTDGEEADDSEAALDLEGDDGANVKGFDLQGEAVLELTQGATELTGTVKLPVAAFADPEGNPLTGTVRLRADMENGLRLDGIEISAPRAFIGSLEIHNLVLSFSGRANPDARPTCNSDSPGIRWDGQAELLKIPTPDPLTLRDVGFGFADGTFSYARASWLPGDPGRAIGAGVRVQKVGFSLCAGPPVTLAGRIGLTALPDANGDPTLTIPDAGLKFVAGDPWSLRADAPLATLKRDREYKFSDLLLQYSSNGAIDFGGKLGFAVGLKGPTPLGSFDAAVDVSASVDGFIENERFNANLQAKGCLSGTFLIRDEIPAPLDGKCLTVDGVVSSVGFGVCAAVDFDDLKVGRIGVGYQWGGALEFMGRACDLSKWTVQRPSAAPVGGASAGRPIDMPGGRGAVVAVTGRDAPPHVALHGPGGRELRSADEPDGTVKTGRYLAFGNTATRTTYVVVAKPARGRWRVRSLDGSRVESVRTAGFLPRPVVRATVRGRGTRRTLSYKVRPIRGQRVVFVERGRGAGRVIGSVGHGGRGKFSFRADGSRGRRRVDAIVEQAGIPRRRVPVAAFSGPKPARPALPGRPVVARDGAGLRIAWRGARRADRYAVRLALPDTRRLLFLTDGSDRTVRVPRVPRRGRVVVRVVGLTRANGAGPGAQTSYELAGRRHDR